MNCYVIPQRRKKKMKTNNGDSLKSKCPALLVYEYPCLRIKQVAVRS